MFWLSTSLMTIFDLVFLVLAVLALRVLIGNKIQFERSATLAGFGAIVGGISLVSIFFFVDLLTMHLFPLFKPLAEAMTWMEKLHTNYSWIVMLVGMGAITAGFVIAGRRVISLDEALRASEEKARRELAERQKSERARSESETYLGLIAGGLPVIIAYVDNKLRYRFVNQRFTEWTERPLDRIIGHEVSEVLGTAAFRNLEPHLRVALAGESSSFEQSIPFPDGRTRHSDVSYRPDFGEDGEVRGFIVLVVDVTERKRTENALRDSEQTLMAQESHVEGILDNIADAVVTLDDRGNIETINAAAESMFGYAGRDVLGKNVSMLMPDPDRGRHDGYIKAYHDTGEGKILGVGPREVTALHRDGHTFAMELNVGELEIGGRHVFIGAMRDITERRRAADTLRESERHYRMLIESTPDAVLVARRDDTVTFANSAAVELFGAESADRLVGMATIDLVHPDDREDVAGRRLRVREGARTPLVQRRRLRLDGSDFQSESRAIPFTWDNEPAILLLARDITERLQREEALRQAQKMEAVGQLTAGVAHDFNNLLTVVIGNLEILETRLEGDRDNLDIIGGAMKGATRGADLTHRLLAFSRKQPLVPKPINAGQVVSGMMEMMRRTLSEEIEIETVADGGLWRCEADAGQLEEAVLNLALNARDAMPDGGKLTIESGNARLDEAYAAAQVDVAPGQYVVISVTDTGVGIPAGLRSQVFEPFFTTKDVGEGTGLGLSMVYGFAMQSGGHAAIYSERGIGTTVKIYLPRIMDEGRPKEPETGATDIPAGRGETVLLVEDDADLRTLAVTMLRDLGYEVLDADSGVTALEHIEGADGVDLLLTDVVLPGGMNGRVLADEVRRRRPAIKVLYMSGYTENAIIHHGRLDRGAVLLQKPFRKRDLARMARSVLD